MYICSICCRGISTRADGKCEKGFIDIIHCTGCFRSFHGACVFNVPKKDVYPVPIECELRGRNKNEFIRTFACQFCKFFDEHGFTLTSERNIPQRRGIFAKLIESLAEWVSDFVSLVALTCKVRNRLHVQNLHIVHKNCLYIALFIHML